MKKLGLIGGTGPESTLIYYKELNHRINEMVGEFPEIIIESINLNKASAYIQKESYEELIVYFSKCIKNLEASGAELIALTAGTMHIIYDELASISHVPILSIPKTIANYAFHRRHRRLGLLGTIFTMEKDYLKKPFLELGIEIVVPNKEERKLIHNRIFNELEKAIVKEETVNELLSIIERMKEEEHIDGIILGCTELPLALNQANCPIPVLDIMDIHIDELCQIIIK